MGVGGLIFVAVAGLIVVLAALSQIVGYRRRTALLTPAQLGLRLIAALLLLAVLGLSVWGIWAQSGSPAQELPAAQRLALLRAAAVFWTVVLALLAAAIVLALVDLRYVRAAQHRARAEMYRKLAHLQEELRARRSGSASGPAAGSGEP